MPIERPMNGIETSSLIVESLRSASPTSDSDPDRGVRPSLANTQITGRIEEFGGGNCAPIMIWFETRRLARFMTKSTSDRR